MVILPVENLTGDASFDWVSQTAPTIIANELGREAARAASASDGYLDGAGRLVHGYFTRDGSGFQFEFAVENAATHRMIETRRIGGAPLMAATAAARAIDPAAKEFSSTKEDAVEAWGRGDFEKAVTIDPDFGAAWLGWIEKAMRQNDRAQAISIADRALERAGLRSDLDRARIELVAADLKGDASRRLAGLEKLSALSGDRASRMALAEAEMKARNFPAAVAAFQAIVADSPNDAPALLSLGYAQAYAGSLDAAKATFEKYGISPGQKPNSLDSLGEAYFINGRFAEAEKYFLEAQQSNPAFGGGAELLKAAYAHWLAGDLKGADQIAAKYFAVMKNDPWREASWLYSTGRRDEAIAKLHSVPDARLVEWQLAVWNASLPSDLDALKATYEKTSPADDREARVFYAAALVKAGQKDEARKLLERWPVPVDESGDPLLQSRVFPVFLEVRKEAGAR